MDEIDNKTLMSTIAKLESKIDLIESEVIHLNELLVEFGFSGGIKSLKKSIQELLPMDKDTLQEE